MNSSKRGPVIAVSGPPGGGKTTYARLIARDFGLELHSAGNIFRKIARKLGVDLEELNKLATEDPSIDFEIDRITLELGRRGNVVVEGHLVAWVLAYTADVKIYITAPLNIRVKRIAAREGRSELEVLRETLVRENMHAKRFKDYYGFNVHDLSIFDLVIDTSKLSIEEAYEVIKTFLCNKLKRLGYIEHYQRACISQSNQHQ